MLGAPSSTSTRSTSTLGTVLKYREDQERVREHGFGAIVARPGVTARPRRRDAMTATGADRVAVAFARLLRAAGLDVPVGATITFAEALAAVGLDEP